MFLLDEDQVVKYDLLLLEIRSLPFVGDQVEKFDFFLAEISSSSGFCVPENL